MFFKQCKALFAPLAVMIAIVLVVGGVKSPVASAEGNFVWAALLGAALGCVLALIPLLHSPGNRERFATQRWFACAMLLAVLVYQYMAEFARLNVPWLAWLRASPGYMVFAEGCLTGYCLIGAVRAKR